MRILLVEDDADLVQFIRKGLKEEQYAVDVANDGEAGLALALDNPYDLVILDIMLPKLDGLTCQLPVCCQAYFLTEYSKEYLVPFCLPLLYYTS